MNKKNLLFKEKQVNILLALRDPSKDWNISELAKSTNTTYAHACNFINACERQGITTNERHGKIKVVKLSEKGKKIADFLFEARNLLSQQETSAPEQKSQISTQE